jgi:putative addiction module component (TIGR02574 family)
MPLTLEQITDAAMDLPADSKLSLVEKLVESLATDEPAEIERLWSSEAVRRRDEVRSGRVKAISGKEVLEEARRLVGR